MLQHVQNVPDTLFDSLEELLKEVPGKDWRQQQYEKKWPDAKILAFGLMQDSTWTVLSMQKDPVTFSDMPCVWVGRSTDRIASGASAELGGRRNITSPCSRC